MAKQNGKVLSLIGWILGVFGALVIPALFISGSLMTTFLGIFPLLVHKIIGWSILVFTIIGIIVHISLK